MRNQMKYCEVITLLNVTNANVCMKIQDIKSRRANNKGKINAEIDSWGNMTNFSILPVKKPSDASAISDNADL